MGRGRQLFVAALIAAASCGGPDSTLQEGIAASCHDAAADPGTLDLSNVAGPDWDRLFVFPPYTPKAYIASELGPAAAGAPDVGIEYRDDITLLVFVYRGQVAAYTEQPITCDFSSVERAGGWSRDSAKFGASSRVERGMKWVTLRPPSNPAMQQAGSR